MDMCSICLQDIEDKHLLYTLSCNHTFHFSCVKAYMLKNNYTFFIDCPLCRQMNTKVLYPYESYKLTMKVWCSQKVGKVRCNCETKEGTRCKNKSILLNYGRCYTHHKDILPEDKYEPLCKYLYHLFMCSNRTWETKVYLFDVTKKLLIKFKDDIHSLDDIYRYLFIYIDHSKKNDTYDYYNNKSLLYNYYELELPPANWVKFCVEKRCLL